MVGYNLVGEAATIPLKREKNFFFFPNPKLKLYQKLLLHFFSEDFFMTKQREVE